MINIKNIFIVAMVFVLAIFLIWKFYPTSLTPFLSNKKDTPIIKKNQSQLSISTNLSSWVWDSPDKFTKDELIKMFQIAKDERITTLYLRMDDYADIYGMKDGINKKNRIQKLNEAARQFILLASEYNIEVQALGGYTNWAEIKNLSYPNLFFEK